jgi:amidase
VADLHDLTLLEQAQAVRDGQVSPVELVDHYLDRIERWSDEVGAFVFVATGAARDAARRAEATVGAGAELPPLHGVPTAIKDLSPVAGMPTGFGTAALSPVEADTDDAFVAKLRAAGLVLLGKTATPEFGAPCYTEPEGQPPARTPWDLTRSAGGSSGGAAAAVASGLVPAAPGSDGGGSVRIPASVCGLVGLKTSRGRVSGAPRSAEISGFGVHGPLGRTVRDVAALLDAMAGPTDMDWSWLPPPASGSFLAGCDAAPKRLRIGRYRTPAYPTAEVHPDCVAAYEQATQVLIGLGHEVVEHETLLDRELIPRFETVWCAEFATIPIPPEAEGGLRPLTRWLRERGAAFSAVEVLRALAELRMIARRELERSAQYDAVLTPTLAQPPVPVGALRDDADPARDFDNQFRFTPFTSPYNLTGQPAITVPLHWTDDGLPIGIQLVGRPAGEAILLSLAAQLEDAVPWIHRTPPCW